MLAGAILALGALGVFLTIELATGGLALVLAGECDDHLRWHFRS